MIYQRKQEELYQKRSTPASLPPVVNMPTFYFQQLKPELSKQYLDNNKQNYNNYLVIFVFIPKPAASDCPFRPVAMSSIPGRPFHQVMYKASFWIRTAVCNITWNNAVMKKSFMDITESVNWKDILAYYQGSKDECRERRLSTNPQVDQLSQAHWYVERRLVTVIQFIILCAACENWVWEIRWLMPVFAFLTVLTLQGQMKKQADASL